MVSVVVTAEVVGGGEEGEVSGGGVEVTGDIGDSIEGVVTVVVSDVVDVRTVDDGAEEVEGADVVSVDTKEGVVTVVVTPVVTVV